MNRKSIVIITILVLIVSFFAYNFFVLPQNFYVDDLNNPGNQAELLGGFTAYNSVNGIIVTLDNVNIMLSTAEGVLTIKKAESTKYIAYIGDLELTILESGLVKNEVANIVFGLDESTNKMTALTVAVERQN